MARKTRKDRDLERSSRSTLYVDIYINTIPPAAAHQVLLPPASPSAAAATAPQLLEPVAPAGPSALPGNSSDNLQREGSQDDGRTPATLPAGLAAAAPSLPGTSKLGPSSTPEDAQPAAAATTTARASMELHDCAKLEQAPTSSPAAAATAAGQPPRWEKVLWKQQPYSDNYVDESFLKELVVNAEVPTRHFSAVALDAAAVVQQLALVTCAVVMPVHLRAGRLSARHMLLLDALLLLLGYVVCAVLGGHLLGGSLGRGVRQGVLLVGGVYLLSPLLKTLAATISEDSVIALTAAALLFHLFLHDYNFVNAAVPQLTGTLALAAAAVSAVLVASMMPSELHVFAQVLFSLELFLLAPFVRRYIRAASDAAHVACAALLALVATALCVPCSLALAATVLVAHVTLGLLCPAGLVSIHKYKAKINGPWDEAVPRIPHALRVST